MQVGYSNIELANMRKVRMKGVARTVFGLKIKASGNFSVSALLQISAASPRRSGGLGNL